MKSTNQINRRNLYWWAQYAPPKFLKRKQKGEKYARLHDALHMIRDGAAAMYVSSILSSLYNFKGVLPNLPKNVFAKEGPAFAHEPRLKSSDAILTTTRVPLDDNDDFDEDFFKSDPKALPISGSKLEERIFSDTRRFFLRCNREWIILSQEICGLIDKQNPSKKYQAIAFYKKNHSEKLSQNGYILNCGKTSTNVIKPKKPMMVGYFIFYPKSDSPDLIASFAASGTATILFASLLFKEQYELIREIVSGDKPRIILGGFSPDFPDDLRPTTLDFKSDSALEILLDVTLA